MRLRVAFPKNKFKFERSLGKPEDWFAHERLKNIRLDDFQSNKERAFFESIE